MWLYHSSHSKESACLLIISVSENYLRLQSRKTIHKRRNTMIRLAVNFFHNNKLVSEMLRNHKLLNTPGRNMNQKNCKKKKKKKEKKRIAITEYLPRGRYRSLVGAVHGVTKSWTWLSDWATSLSRIGEGNGKPLQCSCLENPRDGGAWWAAVYGVAQCRPRLKRLSSSSSRNYANCFKITFLHYLCLMNEEIMMLRRG